MQIYIQQSIAECIYDTKESDDVSSLGAKINNNGIDGLRAVSSTGILA